MKLPCTRLQKAAIFKVTGRCAHTQDIHSGTQRPASSREEQNMTLPSHRSVSPGKHRPREARTVTQVTKTEMQSQEWLDLEGQIRQDGTTQKEHKSCLHTPSRSWHVFKGQDCKKAGRKCNWEGKYMRKAPVPCWALQIMAKPHRRDGTRGTRGGWMKKCTKPGVMRFRASAGTNGSVG